MAVTKYASGGTFVPIRSGNVCPVCGSKKGRCAEFYNDEGVKVFYRCRYRISHRESYGWYLHTVQEVDGYDPNEKPVTILPDIDVGEEMTEERLSITDKAYRHLRELVKKYEGSYLNLRDMKNLQERGLSEDIVERMMYFSVPTFEITSQEELDQFMLSKNKKLYVQSKVYKGKPIKVMVRNYFDGVNTYDCQLATAITKDMELKFGEELLKVAGFIKRKDSVGKEYITLKTSRYNRSYEIDPNVDKYLPIKGFFIPYINADGKIQAIQYRLTVPMIDEKGKLMRYFWYSSSNARSGSPIDYYIPSKIFVDNKGNIRDDIILVTEGAIKAKIAAEKLGFKAAGEAGVSNYRRLIETINEISKREKVRHKIILALDMDKLENDEVLKAEQQTITLLLQAGYEVALATWDVNVAKGIDDALLQGLKINYTLV